jgi:trigger factor
VKVEIKDISQVIQEAIITVDAETALKDYTAALKRVANKVVIPGFRKGKAPISRVEREYASYGEEEYYRVWIDKYYQQALKESEMQPITEPVPENVEWEKGKEFVLTLKYEVEPKIEITKYEGLEVPFAPMPVQVQIDNYIESLRNRASESVDVDEPVAEKDIIDATVYFNNDEIKREFLVDPSLGEKFFTDVQGKNIGDEIETEIKKRLVEDEEDKSEEMVEVKISIDAVRRVRVPEVDDDFAKDYEYENLEDMMAKLSEELSVDNERQNRESKRINLLAKIAEANPFEVPPSMVDNYAHHMAEPYVNAYKIEAEKIVPMFMEEAKREVKHYYLLHTVRDLIEVEITDDFRAEMIARFATEAKRTVEEYKEARADFINSDDFEEMLKTELIYNWLEEKNTFVLPTTEETTGEQE